MGFYCLIPPQTKVISIIMLLFVVLFSAILLHAIYLDFRGIVIGETSFGDFVVEKKLKKTDTVRFC